MIINEDFFDDIELDVIVNTDIEENENDQQFNRRISLELNTHYYYYEDNDAIGKDSENNPIHLFPKYLYRMLPSILDATMGINSWGKVRYGFQNSEEKNWIKKINVTHNAENVDYYGSDNYD